MERIFIAIASTTWHIVDWFSASSIEMTAPPQLRRNRVERCNETIAPITIGPGNAVDMTGVSWRWLRDNAERLGVPIWRVGGKSVIPAVPLLQALAREAARQEPRELSDEEERETLRRQLGMERIPQRSAAG